MKKMSKFISILLTMTMCLALIVMPVRATVDNTWIEIADYGTISGTYSNKTYGGGYDGTGIDTDSFASGTELFGKTLTESAVKIEFDHSSAENWRSLGTDGATKNIEGYKGKAVFVFDVYVDVAEGVTEWEKALNEFTIGTSMPVDPKKPTTGSAYVKALRSANVASKIKAVTPQTWTTIEVPFDDTWTEQGWTSALKIGATSTANLKDVDIYLTNMGFYVEGGTVVANDGKLLWTGAAGVANPTYELYCSENGKAETLVYEGTETSYTLPTDKNAVLDYTLKIFDGETEAQTVKVDDIVVRDASYTQTQIFYGNDKLNDDSQYCNAEGTPVGWGKQYQLWGRTLGSNYENDSTNAKILEGNYSMPFDFNKNDGNGKYEDGYRMIVFRKYGVTDDTKYAPNSAGHVFDVSEEAQSGGYVSFLMYDESATAETTDNLWLGITSTPTDYNEHKNTSSIASYIKGYPTNQWVMVTVPFSAFYEGFDTQKLNTFVIGNTNSDTDHKVYIQSINFYKGQFNATEENGVISWTNYSDIADPTYKVYCSANGGAETEVYSGTDTSYEIPQDKNAVCDYRVVMLDGETELASAKFEDIIVRNSAYTQTQIFYGNDNNKEDYYTGGGYGSYYAVYANGSTHVPNSFKTTPVLEGARNLTFDFATDSVGSWRFYNNQKITGEHSSVFDVSEEAQSGGYVSFLMYDESESQTTTDNLQLLITDTVNPWSNYADNFNIAHYIQGYPTNEWVMVTVPFSAFHDAFDYTKLQYFQVYTQNGDYDHKLHIQSINFYKGKFTATEENGVISWTNYSDIADPTYKVYCSANGGAETEVYSGTDASYEIPQDKNAVCDYRVVMLDGETEVATVEIEDVIVRNSLYEKQATMYDNITNDWQSSYGENGDSPYEVWVTPLGDGYNGIATKENTIVAGRALGIEFKENYTNIQFRTKAGNYPQGFDFTSMTAGERKNAFVSFYMYVKHAENKTVSGLRMTPANLSVKYDYNNSDNNLIPTGTPTNEWVLVTVPADREFKRNSTGEMEQLAKFEGFALDASETSGYKVYIQSIELYKSPYVEAEVLQGVKSVPFGGGGMVTGIVIANDGKKYVRTDVGGSYRFDEANEEWIQLNDSIQRQGLQQSYYGVAGIGVDPRNSDVVYEAVGSYYYWSGAVKKSTDGGKTWKILDLGVGGIRFEGNGNDGRNHGECIAVDENGTAYVGTPFNGLYIIKEDETYVNIPLSTIVPDRDYTATWEEDPEYYGIRTVLLDGNYIYLGIDMKEEEGKECADGVYRVNKDGTEITKMTGISSIPRGMTKFGGSIWAVAKDANGTNRIYKTVSGNEFAQYDIPWACTETPKDEDMNLWNANPYADYEHKYIEGRDVIMNITSETFNGKEHLIFATDGTSHRRSKIFCYDGENWSSATIADVNSDINIMTWRASDRDVATGIKDVEAYANPNTGKLEVYVTTGWGVFKTRDYFAEIPQFEADVKGIEEGVTTNMLYVPATDGADFGRFFFGAFDFGGAIYKNINSYDYKYLGRPTGTSESNHDLGLASGSAYALDTPNKIAVYGYSLYYTDSEGQKGVGSNLFLSNDGGDTWSSVLDGHVKYGVSSGALAMSKSGNNIVIIPTNYYDNADLSVMPMYSKDNGATWNNVTGLRENMLKGAWTFGRDYLEADNNDNDKFYALDVTVEGTTRTYSIYESTDGGANFTLKNSTAVTDSKSSTYIELKQDPESDNLYIVSKDGIFVYDTTTTEISKLDGFTDVYSISFGKNKNTESLDVKYVLGTYNETYGLYKSEDGVNYVNIIDKNKIGLANANKIEADKDTYGRVYISTDGRGVLYTTADMWEYDVAIDGTSTDKVKDGALTVKVSYKGINDIPSAVLISALKDKDGRIKKLVMAPEALNGVWECETQLSGTENGDTLNLYLWENLTTIKPIEKVQKYMK